MVEFRLPDLGEGVAEAEVVRWLVREGQTVTADQPMVEVMTDKATVEIPSPRAGLVARIAVAEGEVVPVGTVLLVIAPDETALAEAVFPETDPPATAPATAKPAGAHRGVERTSDHVLALPSVRRLARDLGVDIGAIAPRGPGSRITADDVRRAAGGRPPPGDGARAEPAEGVPLTGMRRVIARRMEEGARIPSVTVVEECDFTEIADTRAAASRSLSYLAFVLKGCARALRDHPYLNATFVDGRLRHHDSFDIGVAVQTDAGLIVPVVRRVDERSLGQIDDEVSRLTELARAGRSVPADLEGGGFTVTSPGPLGGLWATPIINVPQVAILGVYRVAPCPVVRADQVVIRSMGNVSLTFDHRVIDGLPAARFLHDVVRTLEHPGLLLL